jgi:uncharacterized protein YcfJ|tara:strand:+ start:100 stop:600 length:501 start_codon:yes stop_codon:yes gene_type:complete
MKKLLVAAAFIGLAPIANAEAYAIITHVEPNYENVRVNVPTTSCRDVEVPIYGVVQRGGASGGDVLTGMIIGGLLGKGITGKDNGAAAGAVFGGVIAADKGQGSERVITGYSLERRCTNIDRYETQERIKNFRISYELDGTYGQSYTYNRYRVGDRIPVSISIQAN